MVPARRRLLLSFQGQLASGEMPELDKFVVAQLQQMLMSKTTDKFLLEFTCPPEYSASSTVQAAPSEWIPCGTDSSRTAVLRASTFSLILAPIDPHLASTPLLLARLAECLKNGAVPVLLGDHLKLPFADTILWKRAVLHLPKVISYIIFCYLICIKHLITSCRNKY